MKTLVKLTLGLIVVSSWQCGSNPVTVGEVEEVIPATILNLNFEQVIGNDKPQFGDVGSPGYETKVDGSQAIWARKTC